MKKIWKAEWTCSRMKLFELPLILLEVWTAGFLLVMFIVGFLGADDYVPLGSCLGFIFLLLGESVFALNYSRAWRQYGSMGVRRKDFFTYMCLRQMITIAGAYVLLMILSAAEQKILSTLYPGLLNQAKLNWLYNPALAAAFILACFLYSLLGGALTVQCSEWVPSISILLSMTLILGITTQEGIRKFILSVPTGLLVFAGAAAAIAAGTVILKINRKMAVL